MRRWAPLVIAAIAIAVAATWYVDRQIGNTSANASSNSMHSTTDKTKGKANRLGKEKSPYLLQHAYNPVDWYPWGEEAFEKARKDDKPIFLSIGYSTCHWCHVMERESFEDDSIAALLNEFFVSIKVDREERPDIDRIYMTAMQAMGQGGGWPLNVFLTPDLEPFFGGTYFPPRARYGRPGMPELATRVHEAWLNQRQQIEDTGAQVLQALAGMSTPTAETSERAALIDKAYELLSGTYDAAQGGFGKAPKFPSIVNLNFLMRYWAQDPDSHGTAQTMALRQLDAMRAGGIHDHLGGGFHRYSTDARWLVPHFEKMLYDQSQIAWGYLEAYQATGRQEYAETARGIFTYVSRDLSSPQGGFYSAEDADSEGEEGKFYVWTPAETEALLGKANAEVFDYHYEVSAAGNFEHGTSILNEVHSLAETAEKFSLAQDAVVELLAEARAKLLEARGKRIRPHLDDKVLTAWNGIMISAYARGARVLDDPALAERAEAAAQFIWDKLHNHRTGEMTRRWRDGEAFGAGQLVDYVYYALGLIDLYGATFEPRWLERAAQVTDSAVERFWDEEDGAFFESPGTDASVKVRMKDTFDGAEMAGNSIAALTLLKLAAVLDRDDLRQKANRMLDYFSRRMNEYPAAMPQMLVAMDLERSVTRHVVVAGDPAASDTQEMIRAFNHRFLPHDDLLLVDGGSRQKELSKLASFTAPLTTRKGKATAYVCVDYACRLPTSDPTAFAAQLDERPLTP